MNNPLHKLIGKLGASMPQPSDLMLDRLSELPEREPLRTPRQTKRLWRLVSYIDPGNPEELALWNDVNKRSRKLGKSISMMIKDALRQ